LYQFLFYISFSFPSPKEESVAKMPFMKEHCFIILLLIAVDARQRNERNARMGAAETGWLHVGALSGSADFTGKLNISYILHRRKVGLY
jgi:hypothetical protein